MFHFGTYLLERSLTALVRGLAVITKFTSMNTSPTILIESRCLRKIPNFGGTDGGAAVRGGKRGREIGGGANIHGKLSSSFCRQNLRGYSIQDHI